LSNKTTVETVESDDESEKEDDEYFDPKEGTVRYPTDLCNGESYHGASVEEEPPLSEIGKWSVVCETQNLDASNA
jgi:hypothetical protein